MKHIFLFLFLSCMTMGSSALGENKDAIDRALREDPAFDAAHPPTVVELQIPSGDERLPAHIYVAAGEGPHPTVVLLHGFPGNEKNLDIAQALRRFGFNTVFFHYRGAWGATGDYALSHLAKDALAVLAYLRDPENSKNLRVDGDALSVLGHSLGGYTALAAGARDDALACVMALSPVNLRAWKAGLDDRDSGIVQRLTAYADSLFMLEGLTGEKLFAELAAAPDAELDTERFGPALAGKRVLMLVGDEDDVTPAETMFNPVVEAYRAQEGLAVTAAVISGDHSFSWSRIDLTRRILAWAGDHCR